MTAIGVSVPGVLGALADEGTANFVVSSRLLRILYCLLMLLFLADGDCCTDSSKVTTRFESRLGRECGAEGRADAFVMSAEEFSAEVEAAGFETEVAEIAAAEEGSGVVEDATGD
jgi:hypothetical protein